MRRFFSLAANFQGYVAVGPTQFASRIKHIGMLRSSVALIYFLAVGAVKTLGSFTVDRRAKAKNSGVKLRELFF